MYKLLKREENYIEFKENWDEHPFNGQNIFLWDLDSASAYGRYGGTNYENTKYKCMSLRSTCFSDYFPNAWATNMIIEYELRDAFLTGKEIFENDFNHQTIIDRVEYLFDVFIGNILPYLSDDIKLSKRNNIFWSDKGFVFKIYEIKKDIEYISVQNVRLVIRKATIWESGKNNVYYEDSYKTRRNIPKSYNIVNKSDIIDLVRKNYNEVANVFLSQF